jgi:hypothetical protein
MYSLDGYARILLAHSLYELEIKVQRPGVIALLSLPNQEGLLTSKCGGLECQT